MKKMGPMAEACEECTQNCLMMHKKQKNPESVVTTFFKVMMGDDYSKILYLPPRFARACNVKKMVGKTTHLEDLNGEKWNIKITKNNDNLVFEEGWNKFALAHGLKLGDFLVFHFIMKSHFVVLMYGASGCPEKRHFGFPYHPMKENKNNNNLIAYGQSPSKVNTNGNHFSHESSSQSEHSVHEVNENKTINKTGNDDKIPPNVNATNNHQLVELSAPPMDKETGQRSKPLVGNTIPDYMVSEIPTTVEPLCLVDNGNGHEQDECRRNSLPPELVESDGGQKNNVAAGGGGGDSNETVTNRIRKSLETRIEKAAEKRKETTVIQSEASISVNKRLKHADVPTTPAKITKKEPEISGSRLYNGGYPLTSTKISSKPMAKKMEPIKKEPSMNPGSDGPIKKEPTMIHDSGGPVKREPKPEPVDYEEALPSGPSNTSFSAVMSSYQYLELPDWVKLKYKVILLRNGTVLWPVLYQTKFGLKALTQNWGIFAKEKGIKVGDKCEFVLESETNSRFTCNVYSVHVIH